MTALEPPPPTSSPSASPSCSSGRESLATTLGGQALCLGGALCITYLAGSGYIPRESWQTTLVAIVACVVPELRRVLPWGRK